MSAVTDPQRIDRFRIEVHLGLAMVPAFAPLGWDAAAYERHFTGDDPLPEVLAWHAEHWPEVRTFADFTPHLDLAAWDLATWVGLASTACAGGLTVVADPHVHPHLTEPGGDQVVGATTSPPSSGFDAGVRRSGAVLRRGLGASSTWNRVEGDDDRLGAADLVAVIAAAAARGDALALTLGPLPDGSVPPEVASTLGAAGHWLSANVHALADVDPFDVAGDPEVRYTARPGPDPGTRTVYVIDLTGAPTREIAHFSPHRYPIEAVDGAADWSQGPAGVRLIANPAQPRPAGQPAGVTYELTIRAKRARVLAVTGERAPAAVRIDATTFPTLAAALDAARPGDQIDLPAARYGSPAVTFPIAVPAGVTIAGVSPDDPTVDPPTLDGADVAPGTPLVVLADDAGIEGLTLIGPARRGRTLDAELPTHATDTSPLVTSEGAHRTVVERCVVHGSVHHDGGADHAVSFNTVAGGAIRSSAAERVTVTGNRVLEAADHPTGAPPTGTGISISGGTEHRVDANTVSGVDTGIRLTGTRDATVSSNAARAERWAIHLVDCNGGDVSGNQCRGGRGVTLTGGEENHVMVNVADGTGTGLLLERGAGGTVASGNQFLRCRVGILSWSHHASALDGNRFVDCDTNRVR